jgi:hypothetical protein
MALDPDARHQLRTPEPEASRRWNLTSRPPGGQMILKASDWVRSRASDLRKLVEIIARYSNALTSCLTCAALSKRSPRWSSTTTSPTSPPTLPPTADRGSGTGSPNPTLINRWHHSGMAPPFPSWRNGALTPVTQAQIKLAGHTPTDRQYEHFRRSGRCRAEPVKPSAQPTLVRIQHLPPSAETATDLGVCGRGLFSFWSDGVRG